MPLTQKDLSAIYRACETLTSRKKRDPHWFDWIEMDMWRDIHNFYGHNWGNWSEHLRTRQNERIMALLFFAAAGGEL